MLIVGTIWAQAAGILIVPVSPSFITVGRLQIRVSCWFNSPAGSIAGTFPVNVAVYFVPAAIAPGLHSLLPEPVVVHPIRLDNKSILSGSLAELRLSVIRVELLKAVLLLALLITIVHFKVSPG